MIRYRTTLDGIIPAMLTGFFVGWPNPPAPDAHLAILRGSYAIVLAIDEATSQVVGNINAISDGRHAAFIPMLEVLPDYKGQGIGTKLVRRMLDLLADHYSIDLSCDDDVVPFYERLDFMRGNAMLRRNYQNQSARR